MSFREICSGNIEYCHMAEGRFKVENLENTVTNFSVSLVEIRFLLSSKITNFQGSPHSVGSLQQQRN
jgi:hypothetical protein